MFSDVLGKFRSDYRDMLQRARSLVKDIAFCSIDHSIPGYEKGPLTALKIFIGNYLAWSFFVRVAGSGYQVDHAIMMTITQ